MKAKRQMDLRMDASLGPAELGGLFPYSSRAAGYSHLHRNVMRSIALAWMYVDFHG